MKVAIYHPWIYVKSGLERTIMELKRRSRHDWTIFTSHYDPTGTFPELKDMGIIELERVPVMRTYGPVIQAAVKIARTKLNLSTYHALVICCDGLGSLLNFRNREVPSICLCFTPLRAVYDDEYRARHLDRYRAFLPFVLAAEIVYRYVDRLAWKHYRHVFCISDTVKERVLRGRLSRPESIEVAYVGIPAERIAPSKETEKFFFLPGRIMWTKNLELGISAFQEFRRRTTLEYELVIAGMVDRKSEPYYEKLKILARNDTAITFLPNLDDRRMQNLYSRCYAVLFTAFNEDQGLTPLEAASHAKPVIAVNRGGPTEIVQHGVTGLLAELEVNEFSSAIERLASNPRAAADMGSKALERCRLFTWDSFVNKIDSYVDAVGRHAYAKVGNEGHQRVPGHRAD